jgi:hypothetical protein
MAELERKRPESCLSDLALDRHLAGERLSEQEQGHLRGCPACTARVRELEADAARFPRVPGDVDALARGGPRGARIRLLSRAASAGAALAAAAAILVWLVPEGPSGQRTKGSDVSLAVYVRRSDTKVEQLRRADPVSPGNSIRFAVTTTKPGHLKILGVDQARRVTPYAPLGTTMREVSVVRGLLLEGSIILDETLGAERLVAMLCSEPIPFADVERVVTRALSAAAGDPKEIGRLDLPCAQDSFLIDKVAARR